MYRNPTRENQEKVYRDLYHTHRGSPMAVSSESPEHKKLRFSVISRLFGDDNDFTAHDIGCGIGDFGKYLGSRFPGRRISYSGTEIIAEYIEEARTAFPDSEFQIRDLAEREGTDRYDYLIMSGVFHQRRQSTIPEWEKFYQNLVTNAFKMCRKGIAFNFTSPFVDFYQEQSYYCNLPKLIQFVNDDLGRFFEIHHNYALFELTVFVYNPLYIHSKYAEPEFTKYFTKYLPKLK